MDGSFVLSLVIFIAILVVCYMISRHVKPAKPTSPYIKYKNVSIGMSEQEMLSIMGGKYSCSLLKNNRKKYEWRTNSTSTGCYVRGTGLSFRSYSGGKRVAIYTKNEVVEEVRPYNC